MNELNSSEIPLNEQAKFRLNEINKMKDHFTSEIQEKKVINKIHCCFDYIDKNLIV